MTRLLAPPVPELEGNAVTIRSTVMDSTLGVLT